MTTRRAPSRIIPRAFPGIKPNEIEELIAHSTVCSYSPGTILCRENSVEARFYMMTEIPDVQTGMALMQDAVLRRHFLDNGARVAGPHGPGNGHAQDTRDLTVYVASCPECDPDGKRRFYRTAAERAAWMRQHIDTTGHKPTWENQTPTVASDSTEGSTDGGQRVGDIPQG
jgi:hypothetical protein